MIRKHLKISTDRLRSLHGWKKFYNDITGVKTEKELSGFENNCLEGLILHSYDKVKYYKELFDVIGLIRDNRIDMDRFKEIPILTKDIIRNEGQDLYSNDIHTRKWFNNSTSGSTGEPVKYVQDTEYAKWGKASFQYCYKEFFGIDEENAKKLIIWGSKRDLIKKRSTRSRFGNWVNNTIFFNCLNLTKKNMQRCVDMINEFKPEIIRGYAGTLYDLSIYVKENNVKVTTPKIVVSTADTLLEENRRIIQDIFGVKVFNFYGARDASCIAGECRYGKMHLFTFNNKIEILNDDNLPVKSGEEGSIIITNLHNYPMPLIRYEIGDMALTSKENTCKCGSILPYVERITGRTTDHFITRNGKIIRGFNTLFFHKYWVKKYQVIQEDYERIRILYIPNGEVTVQNKNEIEKDIRLLMGDSTEIVWQRVNDIPKSPQGKATFIKRNF